MADLELFALVLGDSPPSARTFSLTATTRDSVDNLRKKVYTQKQNRLHGIDASDVILWKLNDPISGDEASAEAGVAALGQNGQHLSEFAIRMGAAKRLEFYFPLPVKDECIHIIVEAPDSTPLAHPPQHSTTTPEQIKYVDSTTVKELIDKYLNLLRPRIREFLSSPTLPHWVPPESVDHETRNFYNNLSIPLFNNKPSLLLHELGNTPNPNVQGLFQDEMNMRLLRTLCNTSGSGKTRLLFEGLCRHWGFYFVAAQGTDGIGARDLESMITRMASSPGWVQNIFTHPAPKEAHETNEIIAHNRISKVLFARWTVFQLFIEVAKEIYGEDLNDDIRKRWLLFQILPQVRVGETDPFLALIHICLVGVNVSVLNELSTLHTPEGVLGPAFDPPLNYFFYVLDEAQVAGNNYMGAFADADGKVSRPVLRPLILNLVQSELSKIRTIVSGTGFSLNLFKKVVTSGVGKDSAAWDSVHSTGDFSDRGAQLAYISRYVPSPFLISSSGETLKTRMYEWLRGRHRFTARYLEELMRGHWEANCPISPHRLLNAYVDRLTGFKPIDVNPTLLEQEPEVRPVEIETFQWDKIEQEPEMLEELSHSIHTFITRGVYPMWQAKWETIVEYGLGRFIVEKTAIVDEPLALVSILRYFESNNRTLSRTIRGGMQENKGLAFEELLLLAITKLLREPRPLNDCVQFHPPMPDWAPDTAQIVARNSSGSFEPFDIVDDQPSVTSHGVPFHAESPGDVKRWLETGEAGWCIPGTSMGPDLMTRLQLSNGKVLLLIVQAKCFFVGNQHTVTPHTTAKAIRSLIPDNFFASLIKSNMNETTRKEKRETIDEMLAAINRDTATGLYDILRVVGAFPLTADFKTRSAEVKAALGKDGHALAQLSGPTLTRALASTSHGCSILSMLTMALKRTRGEVDDEAEADEPRRKSPPK